MENLILPDLTQLSEAPLSLTPMMLQYKDIKLKYKNYILLFRLGDFYEMFFEDAERASKILDIALTSREAGNDHRVAMCGIPYHAAEGYIEALLDVGERVAICEQTEDPKFAKGIVRREVTRIITPGTNLSENIKVQHSYLCAIYPFSERLGLSVLDLSTGIFKCIEFKEENELYSEIAKLMPVECLLPEGISQAKDITAYFKGRYPHMMITRLEDWRFDYEGCYKALLDHFGSETMSNFGLDQFTVGIVASGVALSYVKDALGKNVEHIQKLTSYHAEDYLIIESASRKNLELVETRDGNKKNTLWGILDHTITPGGARMLLDWIVQPLLDVSEIHGRQQAIADLIHYNLIDVLQEKLKGIRDIERIVGRIHCELANARDLVALKLSLEHIPLIQQVLTEKLQGRLKNIQLNLSPLDPVRNMIQQTLNEDVPISIRDGGMIRSGIHLELDELHQLSQNSKNWLLEFKARESERTGIKSLKVSYNKVFGYYIEITHSKEAQVPSHYIRKQTLVNAERYITEELKEYEAKILGADERIRLLEYEIFVDLRKKLQAFTHELQDIAKKLSELDVLVSLAFMARNGRYICPEVDYSEILEIQAGRHPIVERIQFQEKFIANDTLLDTQENQIILITGPNMAGKSTYIRQVALITIMAQMGSFVPCEKAHIGVVDRIFTRIGASDDLSQGQSTFMVEMTETANILRYATNKSLVILDEIGRGTSTFDGISIAWAVVEYLHNHPESKARTLFATHYHELTDLELTLSGVKNYNVAVKEWNDEIVFLRKIVRGNADKSYGIHVARLAGLPKEAVERAKEILACLEDSYISDAQVSRVASMTTPDDRQLSLFHPPVNEVDPMRSKIQSLDLDQMTPIQALKVLYELKQDTKS